MENSRTLFLRPFAIPIISPSLFPISGRLFIVFLLLGIAHARTKEEQIVVDIVNANLKTVDLSEITSENRDVIIKILRDAATYNLRDGQNRKTESIGTSYVGATSAQVILLRLNDTETVTRLIGAYRDTYGSRGSFWLAEHFEWAGQASVIPLLAEDFFLEDGDQGKIIREGKGVGLRVIPRSAFSGITAMRVTIASKQFSDETRTWANQRLIQGYYPYDKFRADMRVWWKQNKAAFKAGNYDAVKPPQPESPPPPPVLPNPEDSKLVVPIPPSAKPTPKPPTPTPASIPAPVVAEAVKPIHTPIQWSLWGGIAAVLAASARWLFLRGRGNRRGP